jgi:nucleoside-diphosphate-sugar epimerase
MLEPSIANLLTCLDQRIIVTGGGGWLGMATLDLLAKALGPDFERRVVCFGSRKCMLTLSDHRQIEQNELALMGTLEHKPSLLLHYAFLTKDRAEQMSETDYRAANRTITDTVVSALEGSGVTRVFVASSGAAALINDPAANSAMRLYGELKYSEELRFADWAEAMPQSRRLAIGRIFSLSGPWINKPQAYALASFIIDGLAGRPIEVRATSTVWRSYVAVREVVSIVLGLLLSPEGEPVLRFATGGEALELEAVAQAVADVVGGQVVRAAILSNREDRYVGNEAQWANLLARFGMQHLPIVEQVAETAAWLSLETSIVVSGANMTRQGLPV